MIDVFSIEGVKYRQSVGRAIVEVQGKGVDNTDADFNRNEYQNYPLAFVFQEQLLSRNTFGQFFIDYAPTYEGQDLAPASSSGNNRIRIRNELLNEEDLAICGFADESDCEISFDFSVTSAIIGYSVGVFYTPNGIDRFVKLGFGLGAGWINSELEMNICQNYIQSEDIINDQGETKRKGTCQGKTKIDKATIRQLHFATILILGLYERRTSDYALYIGSETGTIDLQADFEDHPDLKFSHQLSTFEISASWFF